MMILAGVLSEAAVGELLRGPCITDGVVCGVWV